MENKLSNLNIVEKDLDKILDLNYFPDVSEDFMPNSVEPLIYCSQLRRTHLIGAANDSDSGLSSSLSDYCSPISLLETRQQSCKNKTPGIVDMDSCLSQNDFPFCLSQTKDAESSFQFQINQPFNFISQSVLSTQLLDDQPSRNIIHSRDCMQADILPERFQSQTADDNTQLASPSDISEFPKGISQFNFSFPTETEDKCNDGENVTYERLQRVYRYILPRKSTEYPYYPGLHQIPAALPPSILNLHQKIRQWHSDYAFSHAISAQMCQDLLPMDAYVTLKHSLLLSIISAQNHINSNLGPLSVIAVGTDCSSVALIMNRMMQYAQRFTSPMELGQHLVQNSDFIEVSPLTLAHNGVCYIGEWLRLKPNSSYFIKKVLDSARVPATNDNADFPLTCSVWMHWTCCAKNLKKNINDISTFLNIFGIPIILEENISDTIIDFLLEQSQHTEIVLPEDEFSISKTDMIAFLQYVGNGPVTMTEEAEDLLKKYFLRTRESRRDALSQRALIMLRQLAECQARLCLRNYVLMNDVVASILTTEKFIHGIFGGTYSLAPQQLPVAHIGQVDTYMSEFELWLKNYLDKPNAKYTHYQ